MKNLKRQYVFTLIAALWFSLLSGCATNHTSNFRSSEASHPNWLNSILDYEKTLESSSPDQIENLFFISPAAKEWVKGYFTQKDKHARAKALVDWMLDDSGLGLEYQLGANLNPQQALNQRQGNCLSFTMLLVTLANELDVELQYNDVDIPSAWGQDENAGLVFYRHVNAVYKSNTLSQVFDLAMEDYDSAFPQRVISQQAAAAMFHANLGIDALKKENYKLALHHSKLSVSMDPDNSYLWINLGVVIKRSGDLALAERIFKTSLKINDFNSLASSNLERLYREQGRTRLANAFQKRAERARANNPYVQFKRAKEQFGQQNYKVARRHINRAIRLHNLDPNFFEFRSRIHQHFKRYRLALVDLKAASDLSNDLKQRGRYYKKGQLIATRAEQEAKKRQARRERSSSVPN